MSGDTALIQAKRYVKKTLQGQGALKGQDGFSPTVKENPSNTDNDYRLDITDKNGTITTPNLKGADGSGSDYKQLKNKPSINGVEIDGNKTLDDLGIQPKGEYLTEETDPTVPQWAKENTKPTYTASEVGADSTGSADMALSDAKEYTDNKIADLVGGAPETLDTLKEIADALETEQSTVEVLQEAIGAKLNKDGDSKDNTVTFVQSETRENIDSGDKHSVLFGKIRKWLFDLKEVAFSGSYTDLNNKPSAEDIGALPKDGNATSATKATNDGDGNNIAETYATKIQVDEINDSLSVIGKCKNLLNPTLETKTTNGVTFTANDDRTYSLSGSPTDTSSSAYITIVNRAPLEKGKYKLTGAVDENNNIRCIMNKPSGVINLYDNGEGVILNIDETGVTVTLIIVSIDDTSQTRIIKPMLTTDLNATYDDFVPYTGDGETLTHDVADLKNDLGGLKFSLKHYDNVEVDSTYNIAFVNKSLLPVDITRIMAVFVDGDNCISARRNSESNIIVTKTGDVTSLSFDLLFLYA